MFQSPDGPGRATRTPAASLADAVASLADAVASLADAVASVGRRKSGGRARLGPPAATRKGLTR